MGFANICCCNSLFGHSIKVCFTGCDFQAKTTTAISGGEVKITGKSNLSVKTGITDSTGCVTLSVSNDTSGYEVELSYDDQSVIQSITNTASTASFTRNCVRLLGCSSKPVQNGTFDLNFPSKTLSLTTDSSGVAYYLDKLGSGIYPTFSSSIDGFNPVVNGILSNGYPGSFCCSTGVLSSDSNHICTACCDRPVCKTLDLTDSVLGSCQLKYGVSPGSEFDGYFNWNGTWNGTMNVPFQESCGCPSDNVDILYILQCKNGAWLLSCWMVVGNPALECPCPSVNPHCPGKTLAVELNLAYGIVPMDFSDPPISLECNPFEVVFQESVGSPCYDGCGSGTTASTKCGADYSPLMVWTYSPTTITITEACS